MIQFSIIIPTYNRAAILPRCLDSLVCQTFKNFEVIVCDDGSKDDTATVIDRYKQIIPQLTYLKIPNSGSAAKPRNEAVKLARGKWICFLDSDDWWDCNKLQVTASFIDQNPRADIFYHDLMVSDNNKEPIYVIKGKQLASKNAFLQLLYKGNVIPLSSSCVKREKVDEIGPFDEVGDYKSEDFDFWIRSSILNSNYQYIPQVLGFYLKHDGNTYDEAFEWHVINDIPEKYTSRLSKRQYSTFQKWTDYRLGLVHLRRGRQREAAEKFKSALSLSNVEISVKSMIRLLQLQLKKK